MDNLVPLGLVVTWIRLGLNTDYEKREGAK